MTHRHATTRNGGYSLIEVLIATTVLALGTLGLIAILAGSASQQRSASMQNLSVGVVKNADGLLSRMLGRNGSTLGAIPVGQWTNVIMDVNSHYLTVAPGYLLVPEPLPTTVYTVPGPFQEGMTGVSAFQLGDYLNKGNYSGGPTFNNAPISRLRHRRVDLESGLSVEVEVLHYDGSSMIDGSETLTFVAPTTVPSSGDIVNLNFASSTSGMFVGGTMEIDRRESIYQGTAGLNSFNITFFLGWFINKITAAFY